MKTNLRYAVAALTFLTATAGSAPARAQGLEQVTSMITDSLQYTLDLFPEDLTVLRLGVGPAVLPQYQGDNNYKVKPAPLISFRYRDLLEIDNNELKITALSRLVNANTNMGGGRLRFGPTVNLNFGRDENDSPDLTGLGNVGTSLGLGAFVGYSYGPFSTRLRARHDVLDGHGGAVIKGDVSLALYRDDSLSFGTNVSASWVSNSYMDSFYGVDAAQSAASGLPVYNPGSSFRDVTLGVGGTYIFTPSLSVLANVGYARLLGDAADSPLVRLRGSPNQFNVSAYAIYSF